MLHIYCYSSIDTIKSVTSLLPSNLLPSAHGTGDYSISKFFWQASTYFIVDPNSSANFIVIDLTPYARFCCFSLLHVFYCWKSCIHLFLRYNFSLFVTGFLRVRTKISKLETMLLVCLDGGQRPSLMEIKWEN